MASARASPHKGPGLVLSAVPDAGAAIFPKRAPSRRARAAQVPALPIEARERGAG
jgi:hypothetical protein